MRASAGPFLAAWRWVCRSGEVGREGSEAETRWVPDLELGSTPSEMTRSCGAPPAAAQQQKRGWGEGAELYQKEVGAPPATDEAKESSGDRRVGRRERRWGLR